MNCRYSLSRILILSETNRINYKILFRHISHEEQQDQYVLIHCLIINIDMLMKNNVTIYDINNLGLRYQFHNELVHISSITLLQINIFLLTTLHHLKFNNLVYKMLAYSRQLFS